jgi:hypothetical protein
MNRRPGQASWLPFGSEPVRHHHQPIRAVPVSPRHQQPPRCQKVPRDDATVYISAGRLRKWHNQLEGLEDVRNAIKSLTMSRSEKTKLLALTTQIRLGLEDVKEEIKEKLRARR